MELRVAIGEVPDLQVHHQLVHVLLVQQQRRHRDHRLAVGRDALREVELRQRRAGRVDGGHERVDELHGRLHRRQQQQEERHPDRRRERRCRSSIDTTIASVTRATPPR